MPEKRAFHAAKPRVIVDLWAGLPAILLVLVALPLLAYVWYREGTLVEKYRSMAHQAFQAQDYDRAALAFDRLVRVAPSDEDRYNFAISLLETGQRERGIKLMQRLGPDDSTGYALAHIWQARELLRDNEEQDVDRMLLATNHLLMVRNTKHHTGEIDFLLADCFWNTGSTLKALESLRDAAKRDPRFYYDLFHRCQQLSLLPAANEAAARAASYYKDEVAERPLDRVARFRYVELLIWLNEFEFAQAVLQQGIFLEPEGEWNTVIANTYLARFRQGKSDQEETDNLLTYLERAFDADPDSTQVLRELTTFGIDDDSGRIDQLLETALTEGKHNAIAHFVMGSRLWQRGRIDDGVFHMRRAYELDNRFALAANNLAYLELLREDGDFQNGLDIINDVLTRFPDSHAFRETRGQLLTKLQRWEEALNDLEFALPVFPEESRLHASLAECYRNLGQDSLAERHLELSRNAAEVDTNLNP